MASSLDLTCKNHVFFFLLMLLALSSLSVHYIERVRTLFSRFYSPLFKALFLDVGDGVSKPWSIPCMSLLLIYGIQLPPCFQLEYWRLGVGSFDADSIRGKNHQWNEQPHKHHAIHCRG